MTESRSTRAKIANRSCFEDPGSQPHKRWSGYRVTLMGRLAELRAGGDYLAEAHRGVGIASLSVIEPNGR